MTNKITIALIAVLAMAIVPITVNAEHLPEEGVFNHRCEIFLNDDKTAWRDFDCIVNIYEMWHNVETLFNNIETLFNNIETLDTKIDNTNTGLNTKIDNTNTGLNYKITNTESDVNDLSSIVDV